MRGIIKKAPESPCKFFWGCATVLIDNSKGPDSSGEELFTHSSQPVKPLNIKIKEKLKRDRKKTCKNCLRQKVTTLGKTRLSETKPQTALVGTEYHTRYCLLANRPLKIDLISVYQCIAYKDFSDMAHGSRPSSEWAKDCQSNLERKSKGLGYGCPTHSYSCVLRSGKGLHPFNPGAVHPSRDESAPPMGEGFQK
jgi:hypothetical protein